MQKDIAASLGISRSYVSDLKLDPDGSIAKARKEKYRRPCPSCGKPMTGSDGLGPNAPKFCAACVPPPTPVNKGKGPTQLRILGYLAISGPKRFSEIRDDLGYTNGTTAVHLHRMRKAGYIVRPERGVYALPDR